LLEFTLQFGYGDLSENQEGLELIKQYSQLIN